MNKVSFSANVCNSDAPFPEPTLRHLAPALNFEFTKRLIGYDPGPPAGKFTGRTPANREEVEGIMQRYLPLIKSEPGKPLENSLSRTFKSTEHERWSLSGYDHWVIHPLQWARTAMRAHSDVNPGSFRDG